MNKAECLWEICNIKNKFSCHRDIIIISIASIIINCNIWKSKKSRCYPSTVSLRLTLHWLGSERCVCEFEIHMGWSMPCTILKEQILEGSFCKMTSGCSVDGGRPTAWWGPFGPTCHRWMRSLPLRTNLMERVIVFFGVLQFKLMSNGASLFFIASSLGSGSNEAFFCLFC